MKPRPRERPRTILKRPRGRPKAQAKRKVGRPPWNLKTDPDRFAIVAANILNRLFELPERQAAEVAREHFKSRSQSIETLRWKARQSGTVSPPGSLGVKQSWMETRELDLTCGQRASGTGALFITILKVEERLQNRDKQCPCTRGPLSTS